MTQSDEATSSVVELEERNNAIGQWQAEVWDRMEAISPKLVTSEDFLREIARLHHRLEGGKPTLDMKAVQRLMEAEVRRAVDTAVPRQPPLAPRSGTPEKGSKNDRIFSERQNFGSADGREPSGTTKDCFGCPGITVYGTLGNYGWYLRRRRKSRPGNYGGGRNPTQGLTVVKTAAWRSWELRVLKGNPQNCRAEKVSLDKKQKKLRKRIECRDGITRTPTHHTTHHSYHAWTPVGQQGWFSNLEVYRIIEILENIEPQKKYRRSRMYRTAKILLKMQPFTGGRTSGDLLAK